MAEGKKQSKANALYSQATTALREKHRPEFNTLLEGLYKEAGLEYKPRPTPEEREAAKRAADVEKARAKMAELREQFPELSDEQVSDLSDQVSSEGSEDMRGEQHKGHAEGGGPDKSRPGGGVTPTAPSGERFEF